jgi:hypothetical protein
MLGLNDRYLATHPPKDMGAGPLAHELGDGSYVLRRKPDLVLFHVPPGQESPAWRGGTEMVGDPEFRKLYRLVHLDIREPSRLLATVWVRMEDGRVGIVRSADRIVVPGFLLASAGAPVAEFDEAGQLASLLPAGKSTSGMSLALPRGSWRGTLEADGPAVWSVADGTEETASSDGVVTFTMTEPSEIVVRVLAGPAAHVHVRSIAFDRAR